MEYSIEYVSSNQLDLGFTGDEDDIYLYGTQADLDKDMLTPSKDTIRVEELITNGKFALIKRGTIKKLEGQSTKVAVKMLRSKFCLVLGYHGDQDW